ncbi:PH domain-containing protein [Herbiconiux sp. SYSU D00978]|uniref:PH domain-containing protein n=1 Tax=Herbiconiux sp. SYSU D00978 TaxID=2812562 RepID=UPI001A95C90C|nr:PH domain-containing protein [Herbiconiux sp. SYSU D00978]
MKFQPARFRPAFGRVLTVVVAALAALTVALIVVEGSLAALAIQIWPALLVVAIVWALFWRPELAVEEHAITMRNVFRTHHLPWAAIQRIDTKWALVLFTEQGAYTAWAAPAPSRFAVGNVDPNDLRVISGSALPRGEAVRPGDVPSTASGAAAFVVRRHLVDLQEDDAFAGLSPEARRVRSTWNVLPIAVLAALTLASVVALAL